MLSLLLVLSVLFCACNKDGDSDGAIDIGGEYGTSFEGGVTPDESFIPDGSFPEGEIPGGSFPGDNSNTGVNGGSEPESSIGEQLDPSEEEYYEGYFEEDTVDIEINCIEGSDECYVISNGLVTFTNVSEDTVYSISGQLKGNIVIDVGDEYKLDLELHGLSIVSEDACPIYIASGDKVTLTAKKDFENYIYDMREAVADEDESQVSSTVYSMVDLELAGKGALSVVSKNNNGIHSKKDLALKNLSLSVAAVDNALKATTASLSKAALPSLSHVRATVSRPPTAIYPTRVISEER